MKKRYTYYRTIIYKVDRLNDYFDKLVLVGDISNENFDINTKIDIQNQKQNSGLVDGRRNLEKNKVGGKSLKNNLQ